MVATIKERKNIGKSRAYRRHVVEGGIVNTQGSNSKTIIRITTQISSISSGMSKSARNQMGCENLRAYNTSEIPLPMQLLPHCLPEILRQLGHCLMHLLVQLRLANLQGLSIKVMASHPGGTTHRRLTGPQSRIRERNLLHGGQTKTVRCPIWSV